MAIVPGIDGGSLIQALSMGRRDRMAHEQGLLQQRAMQQQMQDADNLRATRKEATAAYRTGNRSKAREIAIGGGDFDYATAIGKMESAEQEAVAKRAEVIGSVAQWADTPEKWDRGIDQLVAMGYSDLAQYKGRYSQEGRMAAISAAGQVKDYFDRTKPVNMAPGNRLVDPTTGKVIHSAPFAPRPITVGEGDTVVEYAPGGGGAAPDDIFSRMISAESNGQQFAPDGTPLTSPAGAIGIAQVMPGTAPEAAELAGVPFDENRYRTDPEYNAALGRAYFEKQLQDFGDPALAVAAYNAGPGAVQEALKKGGAQGWINHVPQETQDYVRKVLGGQGGARVIAQGAPKSAKEWRTLSPQDAQAMGLPTNGAVYQQGPTGEIKAVGGTAQSGPTRQQIGAANEKLRRLGAIENQVSRVERAMQAVEKDGWTGYLGGRVPGGLDPESDTFDKSVRMLATLIRQLTRTPGEGAMSDYESRLAEMTLPNRTDTKEGRREAIGGIRDLIREIKSGYQEFTGNSQSAPPRQSDDDLIRKYLK